MPVDIGRCSRPLVSHVPMGSRGQWALAGALLLLATILALLLSPAEKRSALDPRPSSFRATPQGSLALYLLFEELGFPVDRRLTPFVEADRLRGPLALLAPSQPLTPYEALALSEWVRDGGTLLYAASPDDGLLDTFGLVLRPVVRLSADPYARGSGAVATDGHRWTADTDSVQGFRRTFADTSAALTLHGAVPLLRADSGGVATLQIPWGEGTVLAWSDHLPLLNRTLSSSGAAPVFIRAAADLAAGDTIIFAEYHHGFRGGGSPARAVTAFAGTAAGRMSLQLLVVALGVLLLHGRRFGAPHADRTVPRRSPLEHQQALAEAYRQGGARDTARRLTLAGAVRRLGAGRHRSDTGHHMISRLATRTGATGESARKLLAEWEKGDEADLVTLAQQADRLVREARQS
jgi:hypothetical protein